MGLELLVGLVAGFMILGPRRMHAMMGTLGQAKADFDKVKQELSAQLSGEVNAPPKVARLAPVASLPAASWREGDNS